MSLATNDLLLSVVIPTKNRYETLNILVESLLQWKETRFEVVVQDNSNDNSPFLPILNRYNGDERLKYYHTTTELSAIGNCDLAVSNAKGKYLCFIGDDDGIVEQSIIACEWMQTNNVDVLGCKKAGYTWPDMEHAVSINKMLNGTLQCYPFSGTLQTIDPETEYRKVLKSGGQQLYNIPRLYHGFVSRKVLDALYKHTGTYFPGPVPDMSNAVGLVPFVSKQYHTDIPLVISGHSKKSMSGRNSVRQHQGEIKNEKSIPQDAHKVWSKEVPLYWSAPTIWAEAAIKATERVGRKDDLKDFNYRNLFANCFAFSNWQYYKRIFEAMKYHQTGFKYSVDLILTGFLLVGITFERAKNLFLKIVSIKKTDNYHLDNIQEVMNFVEEKIQNDNVMGIFKK
jgi:glycosyltransferase involved in cell wall biosynthesis